MILDDIGMIAVVNARSRAYSKALADAGFAPRSLLLLEAPHFAPGSNGTEDRAAFLEFQRSQGTICIEPGPGDINSANVIAAIKARPERYFIYSGAGGVLLRNEVLSLNKTFIHVHPGRLPDFRGSTTVYYHLLKGDTCWASAIFLTKSIDQGPLLLEREYPFPFGTTCDLDYEFDPSIRASTLVELLQQYVREGKFLEIKQHSTGGETYFILHPLLRHIARARLEKGCAHFIS